MCPGGQRHVTRLQPCPIYEHYGKVLESTQPGDAPDACCLTGDTLGNHGHAPFEELQVEELQVEREPRGLLDSAIRAPLSLLSPRMKTWTRKPSETAEPQRRQNPKTHRMKQLHHIPKSYFLIVLKAKNNPSFFFFFLLLLFTEGQTDIHIFGRKHIHP